MADHSHESRKWGMVVDIDRCTGCNGCVVACQSENNIPINLEEHFNQRRAIQWIRIERYWEGEYPDVKARFIPVMCQHCGNAPCEPVCPVYATYHNQEGLNENLATLKPQEIDNSDNSTKQESQTLIGYDADEVQLIS